MPTLRYNLIYATNNRATLLTDTNIYNDIHKIFEFKRQTVLADKILTNDEKTEAIRLLTKNYDRNKVIRNDENVESANRSWFEEAKTHLTLSNKWAEIVRCYGLTQNPSNGNYMLVMGKMDIDLRNYLQQNKLTWKERINIAYQIIIKLRQVHYEKAIHRDLHSGNILFSQFNDCWYISDLGFCGPADKSSKSIYGNLPYIAPEIIVGKEYTFASDIYSIAILMWEISSGQPPFINYGHENEIVMNIINGIRPKIVSRTPLKYKNLMKECWDADPLKRPNINVLEYEMEKIYLYYHNMPVELFHSEIDNLKINKSSESRANYTSSGLFTSKIHNFENLPEPRNATEEEQEAFHSKSYDFSIPDNINDFNKSSKQNSNRSSKIINIFKDDSIKFSEEFKKLQINLNDDEKEQQIKSQNININDDEEVYNNQNLHSREQNELEIPEDGF
ncbi:kinase-like domain-containing protein [Rhizophagus clarus]|uniref:Kinase-like domain-containing protein n=1 Tax=Rhizophagus clarus TaxID=94130 RepID=A0A8H3QIB5_9GLOM|nr:kinase-like domain-containing protein [Rhizophagus clarus]